MDIATLKRAAAKLGATVEDDSGGRWRVLQAVAPDGLVWVSSGGPHLRCEWLPGPGGMKARQDAIKDCIERMGYGLEDADEGDA